MATMTYPDSVCVVTTTKPGFTLWPVTCAVTGERIPMFTKAIRKWVEYPIRDEIHTDFSWISMKGYTFLQLTNKTSKAIEING